MTEFKSNLQVSRQELWEKVGAAWKPHLWNGRFEKSLSLVTRLFTPEQVKESVIKKRGEAMLDAATVTPVIVKVVIDEIRDLFLGHLDSGSPLGALLDEIEITYTTPITEPQLTQPRPAPPCLPHPALPDPAMPSLA